jgi:regulator of RNase E activity RraA
VTHQYAHVSEFGTPVEIGGWTISPGDLVHGDRHGVHTIPFSIADRIPETAERILCEERELTEFCRSPAFSLKALDQKLHSSPGGGCEVQIG